MCIVKTGKMCIVQTGTMYIVHTGKMYIVHTGNLYIVQRGIAAYRGRVLTKGKVWGDEMIMESTHLHPRATARAVNYVEAFFVSRDEIIALCKRHPDTKKTIRKHASWMALRLQMVALAKAAKFLTVSSNCPVEVLLPSSKLQKLQFFPNCFAKGI